MVEAPGVGMVSHGGSAPDDGGMDSRTLNEISVKEFHDALAKSSEVAVAVAAIKALTAVIRNSTSHTIMGLTRELQDAAAALQRVNPTALNLRAGCELFLRYTSRTAIEYSDFGFAKARLIERGNNFADTSVRARSTIAELGSRFLSPNCTVMLHGMSRVVMALLQRAVAQGTKFSVIVTEGRPDGTGLQTARALDELGIPTTLILDSGAAYAMDKADMVLVGAEAVVENGGVVNKLGTYQIALCAKACNRPLYVAAESYKFARLFPLTQKDLPEERRPCDLGPLVPPHTNIDNPSRDYTPPSLISLLFTELGVLTPAAVSDELIQLYL